MMLVPPPVESDSSEPQSEPIFFPLAFPVITGPAVITSLLSYMEEALLSKEIIFSAMIIAWVLSVFTLLSSSFFNHILGSSGLVALERLFSIALLLMSANLMLKGISIAFNIGFYIQ
ncbi:multiple antibiotic resistance protein [Chlamydia abortus]|nr:multiple antibiotic resistance protein [Chlamydia abortus]